MGTAYNVPEMLLRWSRCFKMLTLSAPSFHQFYSSWYKMIVNSWYVPWLVVKF